MRIEEDALVELFYDVSKNNKYSRKTKHYSLSPHAGQYRCLFYLDTISAVPQRNLAKILHIQPGSMSEILRKLEKKELILRQTDEADKRNLIVSLTAKGKEAVSDYREKRKTVRNEILTGLTEEEKENFYHILLKIQKNLDCKEHDETNDNK